MRTEPIDEMSGSPPCVVASWPHIPYARSKRNGREASRGAYWHGPGGEGKPDRHHHGGRRAGREEDADETGPADAVLQGPAASRILMEASTISEWVARLLEELGYEVVVADPNYAPMYAQPEPAREDGQAGHRRAGRSRA